MNITWGKLLAGSETEKENCLLPWSLKNPSSTIQMLWLITDERRPLPMKPASPAASVPFRLNPQGNTPKSFPEQSQLVQVKMKEEKENSSKFSIKDAVMAFGMSEGLSQTHPVRQPISSAHWSAQSSLRYILVSLTCITKWRILHVSTWRAVSRFSAVFPPGNTWKRAFYSSGDHRHLGWVGKQLWHLKLFAWS